MEKNLAKPIAYRFGVRLMSELEQNRSEDKSSTPSSTIQEKLADMIVPVLMTGGFSVGSFGAFWSLFKDSDIPKAIASGVIGVGIAYGASLLSPVHQGNHRRLGKFGNWVDRRIDGTIEAGKWRLAGCDGKMLHSKNRQ